MTADKVSPGNTAWPNHRSCGQSARDVFPLAGAQNDKQKAFAFFDWFTRSDAVLAPVIGDQAMPRTEVTKKRTMINADESLTAVFGGKQQVSMFEMTKLVGKHLKG